MKQTNKANGSGPIYDMLKEGEAMGLTAKEFAKWAKKKGYSERMVISLTQEYINCYQRLGTSKK